MEKHRVVSIIILLAISLSCVSAANTLPRLRTGEAVSVKGLQITIDTRFLDQLEANPVYDEWFKNYWELIYLINIGHKRSFSIGFDVLASMYDLDSYDHHGTVGTLAKALSKRDDTWIVLKETKSLKTRKRIFEYYDRNMSDYLGIEGYEVVKTYVLGQ